MQEKRFLVFGTGKSGVCSAKLLKSKKLPVGIYDGNAQLDVTAFYDKNPGLADVSIWYGTLPEGEKKKTDVLVLSPGVPSDLPLVDEMRNMGVEVWGEIELAYRFAKGKVLAITGTNGKTTTTSLLGEIMKHCYRDVYVVGNIGTPYTSVAAELGEDSVTVAEISSFQLETVQTFAPCVTAILNITPDHLDRHHTMDCYAACKQSITKNQKKGDLCVLNYEDERLRRFGEKLQTRIFWFSSERELKEGFYLKNGAIFVSGRSGRTEIIKTEELNLLGKHNYENVMAAVAMAVGFGVPLEKIREVLLRFTAVEHRIEYVAEKRGVRFYNDSKGTNPDAAIKGIRAMNRPTFLIGGGYDKGSAYDAWIQAFDGKVKELVLIGQTKEKIAETAAACGFTAVTTADSLEEAVNLCYRHAVSGDAVLLSPACASWGMFVNYEERGNIFKEIVHNLKE